MVTGERAGHRIIKLKNLKFLRIFLKNFINLGEYFVTSIRVFTSHVFVQQKVSPPSPPEKPCRIYGRPLPPKIQEL